MYKYSDKELEDNSYELQRKMKSRISTLIHKRMEDEGRVGKFSYDEVYDWCAWEFLSILKSMSPYCFNSAIEYARQNSSECGWKDNKDRLDFYKNFNEYLPVWLREELEKRKV